MSNIISVVRDSLEGRQNVSPALLEKVPVYVKRATIDLQKDGVLPPKIFEFIASEEKQERRDGNGNLMYNFIYLPKDFMRLDQLTIHRNKGEKENKDSSPYQHVSNDSFFNRRRDSDDRNFFSIVDYNSDDQQRKILVLDPFPKDDDYIEVRYFVDGTEETLDRFGPNYWEAYIAKVENMLGLKNNTDAEEKVLEESSKWRNQEGSNQVNKTAKTTKVRHPFGKR